MIRGRAGQMGAKLRQILVPNTTLPQVNNASRVARDRGLRTAHHHGAMGRMQFPRSRRSSRQSIVVCLCERETAAVAATSNSGQFPRNHGNHRL